MHRLWQAVKVASRAASSWSPRCCGNETLPKQLSSFPHNSFRMWYAPCAATDRKPIRRMWRRRKRPGKRDRGATEKLTDTSINRHNVSRLGTKTTPTSGTTRPPTLPHVRFLEGGAAVTPPCYPTYRLCLCRQPSLRWEVKVAWPRRSSGVSRAWRQSIATGATLKDPLTARHAL